MRTVWVLWPIALLVGILLPCSPAGPPEDKGEKKPPKGDEVNDDHGNILWRSTAERMKDEQDWIYERTVDNREKERRCRINWKNGDVVSKSLLEKSQKKTLSKVTIDLRPSEVAGNIKYNGGPVAGEGEKEAEAWLPKGQIKAKKLAAEAYVAFDFEDKTYSIQMKAESEVKDKEIRYRLSSSSHILELPREIRLRWKSIESRELFEQVGIEQFDTKTKFLVIEAKGKGEFGAKIKIVDQYQCRNGTIQFVLVEGGNSKPIEVLAEAWLPAFGPPEQP
jgi:hypothetical protein